MSVTGRSGPRNATTNARRAAPAASRPRFHTPLLGPPARSASASTADSVFAAPPPCGAAVGAVTLADVRPADVGAASGTLEAAEQLGSTLGVATIGSLFVSSFAHGLSSAYTHAAVLAIVLSLAIACLTRTLPTAIRTEDELQASWNDTQREP